MAWSFEAGCLRSAVGTIPTQPVCPPGAHAICFLICRDALAINNLQIPTVLHLLMVPPTRSWYARYRAVKAQGYAAARQGYGRRLAREGAALWLQVGTERRRRRIQELATVQVRPWQGGPEGAGPRGQGRRGQLGWTLRLAVVERVSEKSVWGHGASGAAVGGRSHAVGDTKGPQRPMIDPCK